MDRDSFNWQFFHCSSNSMESSCPSYLNYNGEIINEIGLRCLFNSFRDEFTPVYINGLMQDCSNSIANTLELLQSCTKSLIFSVLICLPYGIGYLTHLPLDQMASISQTTFSNTFFLMKMLVFQFNFPWNMFLRIQLTINQHWFR